VVNIENISQYLQVAGRGYRNRNHFRFLLHRKYGTKFKPKAPKFPPMLIVETTNYCNLSCIHCPQSTLTKKAGYKHGFMDFDLYKRIINEASLYKKVILRPFGGGEALIHPDLPKMVRYAKEKGIESIWLNTNGLLLTSEKSKALLDAGLDRIEISIDATTEETYRKIKGKTGLSKVIANTLEYCDLKEKLYPDKKITASFVESNVNASEKDGFISFWENRVDHVNIRSVHQHGALVERLSKDKEKDEPERLPCPLLWRRVQINYYGGLIYCEYDWENREEVGNVKDLSIREIWNGAKYKYLRKLHVERRFSEIPLCSICKTHSELLW